MRPKNAGAEQRLRPSKLRSEAPVGHDGQPGEQHRITVGEDALLARLREHHGEAVLHLGGWRKKQEGK